MKLVYYCELCCRRVPRRGKESDSELIARHCATDAHRDNFYTEATDEEEEEEDNGKVRRGTMIGQMVAPL